MDIIVTALKSLMPLGGWSYDGEITTIHEDGVSYGYTVPTQSEIDAEVVIVENNAPILTELAELDRFVSRETEDLIISANTDSFLVSKANEKKVLRSQLK